jgi:Xaa-Pro aminopeptidase
MNFLHGTGHGIGHYLNVHEGPQRIASYNNEPLRAGQFVSIEPGFYEEGYYGIRIESIFLVKQVDTMRNFGGKWLEFERITQIPIDTALVDWKLLNKEETAWLKEHNKACAKTLLPLIPAKDRRTKSYLKRNLWA